MIGQALKQESRRFAKHLECVFVNHVRIIIF